MINNVSNKMEKIGEGTYGKVYRCIDENKKVYAMKKYKNRGEEIGIDVLREIAGIKALKHNNIIRIEEVKIKRNKIETYYEYMEMDMNRYMQTKKGKLEEIEIKYVLGSILCGLRYMHGRKYIHRDIKPENILINKNKNGKITQVKIADFGLVRKINTNEKYTPIVVTLWYRAPELLLGQNPYSEKIDIWALGCIMGELYSGYQIFKGDSEISQLFEIVSHLSTKDIENSVLSKLPYFKKGMFPKWNSKNYDFFDNIKHNNNYNIIVDLFDKFLEYDPDKRISASEALLHPYFDEVRDILCITPHHIFGSCLQPFPPILSLIEDIYCFDLYTPSHTSLFHSVFSLTPYFSHSRITPTSRHLLFDWLFLVTREFSYSFQTYSIALLFCDSYLSLNNLFTSKLQLLGISCLFLSASLNQVSPLDISSYSDITDNSCSSSSISLMSSLILSSLDFNLYSSTLFDFSSFSFSLLSSFPSSLPLSLLHNIHFYHLFLSFSFQFSPLSLSYSYFSISLSSLYLSLLSFSPSSLPFFLLSLSPSHRSLVLSLSPLILSFLSSLPSSHSLYILSPLSSSFKFPFISS